jgi:hypothetical protein
MDPDADSERWYIYILKKLKNSRFFLLFLLDDARIRNWICTCDLRIQVPDPGGPKTYGSGSPTLKGTENQKVREYLLVSHRFIKPDLAILVKILLPNVEKNLLIYF